MQTEKFYFFETLEEATGLSDIRTKYGVLRRTLLQAVDKRLEGVRVKFAGLLPKIQYLIREYNIRENAKYNSLAVAINAVRVRLLHLETLSDEELNTTFAHDLKATCRFISHIYGDCDIPQQLTALFPIETENKLPERLKSGKGETFLPYAAR